MRFLTLFLVILIPLAMLPLSARAETADQETPATAATRFVGLLDAGTAVDAWQQLSPLAQLIKQREPWQRLHQALRIAYGPREKRTLRGVTLQNRYAMLPDGHYAIVQFDTVFRDKRTAIETVVLVQSQNGLWQVHDYISN